MPDAMSRLLALRSLSQLRHIETDVQTLSVEERCNPSCTHPKVLMTAQADDPHPDILDPDLRGQASRHDHAQYQEGPEKDEIDEDEADFDVFDFDIARQDDSVPDPEDLPSPPTRAEILMEQRHDAFCQLVLSRQGHPDRAPLEGADGLLRRRHPVHDDLTQVVPPESLRPRLLQLAHYAIVAGHPGLNRMYYNIRLHYYMPHLAADVAATVRNCASCAKNRVRLRRRKNLLKLFPATRPMESVGIDILGPLPKSKRGKRFLLVISDRFTKLTTMVALRNINAYSVAFAFCEAWIFKYGPPRRVLSDNGKQFTSRFFQSIFKLLGLSNAYTSPYCGITISTFSRFTDTYDTTTTRPTQTRVYNER